MLSSYMKNLHTCKRPALVVRAAAFVFLLTAGPAGHAGENLLMVLEYVESGKTRRTEISSRIGAYVAPRTGQAPASWRIRAGEAVSGGAPPEHEVEFLRRENGTLEALCIVRVKYFRAQGLWQPAYRLDETPLFVRDGSGWRPLPTPSGNPALIQLLGSTLPNAEGYYPQLEFSLSTGSSAIDSWVVR